MHDLISGTPVKHLPPGRPEARHGRAVPFRHVAIVAVALIGTPDHLALPVLDVVDQRRRVQAAIVDQRGIGVDHPQYGGVARAQRIGRIGLVLALIDNPHPLERIDHVLHP